MMEVVAGGERAGGPFSRHNVQEWSRLDQLTGLLEHARVETDHWTASTSNSSHHFGKVVDSRSRNLADGGQEQRQQTKQLEVFQANIPGGSVQVIRSSTSRSWQSHKTLSVGSGWTGSDRLALPSSEKQDFDHLQLVLNPLDLSSQKTKASVGRSGSIGSRRPPSRPRSIVGLKPEEVSEHTNNRQLVELSSICHKVHEDAKQDLSSQARHSPLTLLSNGYSCDQNDNITNDNPQLPGTKFNLRSSVINEVTKSSSDSTVLSGHLSLNRKKSCSSEDLHAVDEECNETDSNGSDWRRSSKVRRSLQFPPKPSSTHKETIVIPVTKSVSEIKKEIEARKQLVTNSFKSHQWNNFAELEGVLGVIRNGNHDEDQSKDSSNSSDAGTLSPTKTAAKKRQTFITVESLKEVKGRLRKLNSPVEEILKTEANDDGIDAEVKPPSPTLENTDDIPKNSVKSYVFGMEVLLRKTKPPIVGTGSLESRSSNKFLTNGNSRTEEWYNRRKSYGFEQVSNQQSNYSSFENSKIESSTDSGICRSSDIFPSWSKLTEKPSNNQTNPIKTTHSIVIKPYHSDIKGTNDIEGDAVVQKGRKTVVNLTSNTANSTWAWNSKNELSSPQREECKESISKGKIADAIRSLNEKSILEKQRLSEPITISIPIHQAGKSNHTDPTNLLLKQTSSNLSNTDKIEMPSTNSRNVLAPYSELLFGKDTGESSTIDSKSTENSIPWRGNRTKALSNFFDSEFKRHSIAVDQTKYLTNKKSYGSYYFNGIHDTDGKEIEAHANTMIYPNKSEKDSNKGSADSDHELSAHEKKQKRVEFCKTEVHFAAEPGRFNIVETDGKPPPSNLYRRRRKTTSDAPNRSGLPEIRFGDTQYEKNMLLTTDNTCIDSSSITKPLTFRSSPVFHDNEKDDSIIFAHPNIKHVNKFPNNQTDTSAHTLEIQNSSEDDIPKPRSILKNNIPKPKPYLLGEPPESLPVEENSSWGVKLKSIKSDDESPKWQSDPHLPKETEFQRLLKSLRPAANKPPDLLEQSTPPEPSSTAADNGLEVRITSSSFLPDHRRASWSVADKLRHVEDARGYSTKVNFGPQETTVVDSTKAGETSSRFNMSENLNSSWLIKEQNSSFDTKPAELSEPGLKSGKKIAHSQSFSTPITQSSSEPTRDNYSRNILKSTSLVMEVQNPSTNHLGDFEKKVSVKEISTNLIRDSCGKHFQKIKESKNKTTSVGEKISQYSQRVNTVERERKKTLHDINTKTIPQVRKTSSATQTYFVNRSAVRRDLPQATSIKISTTYNEKHKAPGNLEDAMNGIPGVLNALDDLSRCIDEVIIESPQKVRKSETSNPESVFQVKEDYKGENESPQNILSVASNKMNVINQLDLLREIVDSGELSEDSLKADEEVRAYMSTDNDEDTLSSEWSGSWSRMRTLKQNARQIDSKDMVPTISPSFGSRGHSPLHLRQGLEAAVNTQIEPPRVTSISLRYDTSQQPTAVFREAPETKHSSSSFVTRSLLNTDTPGISSKVELSSNGDRTWSFSKVLSKEAVLSKDSESDYVISTSKQPPAQNANRLLLRDTPSSPSRFSRNSQSPTKEALFLERTAERNILYNENNRQMSSSPTCGTFKKVTSSESVKVDSMQSNSKKGDKSVYSSRSIINQIPKTTSQSGAVNTHKPKVEEKLEFMKKSEVKKSNEMKTKERKLSTSSSGRDGWLNTPKEVQVRKKTESYIRKQDNKNESKVSDRTAKPNGIKLNQRRTESPIYQNREIYAERRDSNDNTETESTILEELTKAADQILLAVNGYTDDDSFRASSEDEYRKRREKTTSQPLCTISELPTKKTNTNKFTSRQSVGVIKSTRSTDLRKEYRSSSKTRVGKTSSNSSMESGPSPDVKPLLSPEDRSKRRAARLLQRASSRELLLQTAASSSEDIGSGSDTGSLRTKRVYRRSRLQNGKHSGSKQDLTNSVGESRTKERVQRSAVTSEVQKTQRAKTQTENRCSRHSKTATGSSAGERRERRPQAVVTHSSRTQKKKSETSQLEAKSGVGRE